MGVEITSYESFVNSEFPVSLQAHLPPALKRAYLMVDALMADTSFLLTEGAKGCKGHLLQHSVDYQLIKLIETGVLPFDYCWDFHARPTGKHLKILPSNTAITVSQLQHKNQFPRHADFRNNQRLNNDPRQIALFANELEEKSKDARERPHLVLGHGYQDLNFACIYIPHSHRNIWNWWTPNILNLLHPVSTGLPPVEESKAPTEPSIKEEFVEWLKKNDRDGNID